VRRDDRFRRIVEPKAGLVCVKADGRQGKRLNP
jgi:hypothetical protein